jgi:hypothetical protein
MTISLYKATELARLHSHLDQETGEIDFAAFDAANITLAEKQLAYTAYLKNESHNIEAHEIALKTAFAIENEKLKRRKAAHLRSLDYLKLNMLANGITEIKSNDGMFSAKLGSTQAVEVEEGFVFDDCYLLPAKPREPSKTLIKAAIEAGTTVIGASIVKRDRLVIK